MRRNQVFLLPLPPEPITLDFIGKIGNTKILLTTYTQFFPALRGLRQAANDHANVNMTVRRRKKAVRPKSLPKASPKVVRS